MRRWFRRGRGTGDRGAVLVLSAILLPVLLVITSIGVDLGMQRALRRTMQARADVIALDLARFIDGSSSADTLRGSSVTAAAMQHSAVDNKMDPTKVTVDWGNLTATNQFVSGTTAPATAVKVTTTGSQRRIFQSVVDGTATRSAVAARGDTPIGSFSIGSSLARLNTGDSAVLNPVLSGLLHSTVNLSALDYKGLAGAGVSLADLLAADTHAGSVDELLNEDLTLAQFQALTAKALTNKGMTAQANLLNGMVVNVPPPASTVRLGDLVALESTTQSALNAQMNVIDLLVGAAQIANGSNAVELDTGIPGLTSATIHITEPPKIAVGEAKMVNGQWVTKAQAANLRIDLDINPTALNLDANVLGVAAVSTTLIHVPLKLTGGGATGYLTMIDCAPEPDNLTVLTHPEPLAVDVTTTGTIVGLNVKLLFGLIQIPVSITADLGGQPIQGTELGNTPLVVPVGSTGSADARNLSLGSILKVSNTKINAAGISLTLLNSILSGTLNSLNNVLNTIDSSLTPFLGVLGAKVGDTDVAALWAKCDGTTVRLAG